MKCEGKELLTAKVAKGARRARRRANLFLRSVRSWLALIAITREHGQAWIFRKARIFRRQLTQQKHRSAIRLDAPRMPAIGTQAGIHFVEAGLFVSLVCPDFIGAGHICARLRTQAA